MTDRELLELAAKAARNEIWTDIDGNLYTSINDLLEKPWDPLNDDGDALRLAVKLKMGFRFETHIQIDSWVSVVEVYHSHDGEGWCHCVVEPLEGDPDVAARRAIVRAAAEIGRSM